MARIRAIKPEFWSHPVLRKQKDSSQLLAIALLNLSDDEGYFMADCALVRAFARPFDESTRITQEALSELQNIGWVEIRNSPTHGPIGKVVNFIKHQVINRSTPSKIKSYFESVTAHEVFSEDSQLDGKGWEGNGKEKPLARFTSSDCEEIYELYPRKVGRKKALESIAAAISRICAGEIKGQTTTRATAIAGLKERVRTFAESPAGKRGTYTPHPTTWFNRSSYLDEVSEWSAPGIPAEFISERRLRAAQSRATIAAGFGFSERSGRDSADIPDGSTPRRD